MSKPPRRPPPPKARKKDGDAPARATGRAIIAKPADPRQTGLFDASVPGWVKPCLPTLVDKPPVGAQLVHEIKWDGYRISAYVDDGKVTIRTRNGHDWTKRFPAIAAAIGKLKVRSAVIDGEAFILDDRGRSSFAELQADLDHTGPSAPCCTPSTYCSSTARSYGRSRWRSEGLPLAPSSRLGRRSS